MAADGDPILTQPELISQSVSLKLNEQRNKRSRSERGSDAEDQMLRDIVADALKPVCASMSDIVSKFQEFQSAIGNQLKPITDLAKQVGSLEKSVHSLVSKTDKLNNQINKVSHDSSANSNAIRNLRVEIDSFKEDNEKKIESNRSNKKLIQKK